MAPLLSDDLLAPTRAIMRTSIAIRHAFDRLVNAPLGIPGDQTDLLMRVAGAGPTGLRGVDCARQLRISPSQVSRLTDRAENAGLVARTSDPDDRRSQRIVLTRLGQQAIDDFRPLAAQLLHDLTAATLSSGDREEFVGTLQRLEAQADLLTDSEEANY